MCGAGAEAVRGGGLWSLAQEPSHRREAGDVVPPPSVDPLLLDAACAWSPPLEALDGAFGVTKDYYPPCPIPSDPSK